MPLAGGPFRRKRCVRARCRMAGPQGMRDTRGGGPVARCAASPFPVQPSRKCAPHRALGSRSRGIPRHRRLQWGGREDGGTRHVRRPRIGSSPVREARAGGVSERGAAAAWAALATRRRRAVPRGLVQPRVGRGDRCRDGAHADRGGREPPRSTVSAARVRVLLSIPAWTGRLRRRGAFPAGPAHPRGTRPRSRGTAAAAGQAPPDRAARGRAGRARLPPARARSRSRSDRGHGSLLRGAADAAGRGEGTHGSGRGDLCRRGGLLAHVRRRCGGRCATRSVAHAARSCSCSGGTTSPSIRASRWAPRPRPPGLRHGCSSILRSAPLARMDTAVSTWRWTSGRRTSCSLCTMP